MITTKITSSKEGVIFVYTRISKRKDEHPSVCVLYIVNQSKLVNF